MSPSWLTFGFWRWRRKPAQKKIPEGYRWDNLTGQSGINLKKFYKGSLNFLDEHSSGQIREIYQGSSNNIDISAINELDWFSACEEGLRNLYDKLLEKNVNEKNSVQVSILFYFTPRPLIDVIVKLMKPQAENFATIWLAKLTA